MAVVGAGLAGLAAAHALDKAGCRVIVFEAADRVGGRMSSDQIDGRTIDRGAQFLSESYVTLLAIAAEVGLGAQLVPVSAASAVVRNGVPRVFSPARPWSMIRGGYLGPGEAMGLAASSARWARKLHRLPLDDYSAWADLDTEPADTFSERHFSRAALDYVIEPMLQGFYFQSPAECSSALVLMLIAFRLRRGRVLTLAGGLGALPKALAAHLDVRRGAPVTQVAQGTKVDVAVGAETQTFDFAVLAVPATVARRVYEPASGPERQLLSTSYTSTLNVGIASEPGWALPTPLGDVYGLLVPCRERDVIAAVGIESNKHPARTGGRGELLDVMVSGDTAPGLLEASDEEIVNRLLPELERYLPSISDAIAFAHVVRWRDAEPKSPVGRSRALRDYWAHLDPGAKVVLAGDYMGFPHTESAAHTGVRAARQIVDWCGSVTTRQPNRYGA